MEEFGFGMPPRLWKFKPKNSETTYTINAIPFGGFVRLHGEDSYDAKALKAKNSFASKPVWQKLIIIVAGVAMNFLLAFILLTIGLSIGMQPLIATPEEAFQAVRDGTIELQQGLIVKEEGPNKIGFQTGDKIVTINGAPIVLGDEMNQLKDQEIVEFQVDRAGEIVLLKGINDLKKPFASLYAPMILPQVVVAGAEPGNALNLQKGAVLKNVNGVKVFSTDDLQKQLALTTKPIIELENGRALSLKAQNGQFHPSWKDYPLIISLVIPGSNAEKVGLQAGDQIIAINDQEVKAVDDLEKALKNEKLPDKVVYKVIHNGSSIEYFIHKGSDGLIGVLLSQVQTFDQYQADFYTIMVPYSVLKVNDINFPIWEAPGQAIQEMGKLSVLTAAMFGSVLESIFTKFAVPDGVAGPVGIAQMTFVFVQEGIMSLVRFAALLSLSLGIINILPFPGLDGGRFFLIVIPLILRKKLNPKLEAMIHLFGFLILMLLILMVTFNDIVRLFS